jgi:hypothetical protein
MSHIERTLADNFSEYDVYENVVIELEELSGNWMKSYSE